MVTEASFSNAPNAATAIGRNYSNSAGCSIEQILTPISIVKGGGGPTPGFMQPFNGGGEQGPFGSDAVGPTVNELNPYFSEIFGDDGSQFINNVDYNLVVHEPTNDLNLKKNTNRQSIRTVRTQAFRAPLILSGWGFDMADMPVPASSQNNRQFDPSLVNNRAYWKTGPVHLMWDDQRQVWSGGYQTVCGVLTEKITEGSIESPSTFKVKILRISSGTPNIFVPYQNLDTDLGEEITCINRTKDFKFEPDEEDLENGKIFVVCMRINYEWVLISLHKDSSNTNTFIGTFSGKWAKYSEKSVTQLAPVAIPTVNVNVRNYFGDVGQISGPSNCAYVEIENNYYLIAAECTATPAI